MKINDLIWQAAITDSFWLITLMLLLLVFRRELRSLLGSLSRFKFANLSFELGDRQTTFEYSTLLSNIFLDILAQRQSIDTLASLMTTVQAQQLTRFAVKYSTEMPNEGRDIEIVKNIAIIARKRQISGQRLLQFFDKLLKNYPNDPDIMDLKRAELVQEGDPSSLRAAETIADQLTRRFPNDSRFLFNSALTKFRVENFDAAFASLRGVIKSRKWKTKGDFQKIFDDTWELRLLRDQHPAGYVQLVELWNAEMPESERIR